MYKNKIRIHKGVTDGKTEQIHNVGTYKTDLINLYI